MDRHQIELFLKGLIMPVAAVTLFQLLSFVGTRLFAYQTALIVMYDSLDCSTDKSRGNETCSLISMYIMSVLGDK